MTFLQVLYFPTEYKEVPCDGEPPLVNPVTGLDYVCGDDSRLCPPSSYCHKTASFAKCCREGNPVAV